MSADEQVLCVARNRLPAAWLGRETAHGMSAAAFFQIMDAVPLTYRKRRRVEQDRNWKQLIPYLVVQSADGSRTGCYRRHGSEIRLHDRMSVGVGGHVSRLDAAGAKPGLRAVLQAGMRRELAEEFVCLDGAGAPRFAGVINEEVSPVGEVHLGLVYRLTAAVPEKLKAGSELADFRWVETARLHDLPLELWSRLALSLL